MRGNMAKKSENYAYCMSSIQGTRLDMVLVRQSTAQWLREVAASLWYALGPQLTSVLSVIVKGVAMAEVCR